ncbi:MAG: hypothetical protein MUF71_19250 [Candidatus Kapabacteria bacterium]|jgi:hypothetical protein|nr:hypothetical protein [Candidatus Kapabacteria bacterium]
MKKRCFISVFPVAQTFLSVPLIRAAYNLHKVILRDIPDSTPVGVRETGYTDKNVCATGRNIRTQGEMP